MQFKTTRKRDFVLFSKRKDTEKFYLTGHHRKVLSVAWVTYFKVIISIKISWVRKRTSNEKLAILVQKRRIFFSVRGSDLWSDKQSMGALLLPFPIFCAFGVNLQAMPTEELFTLANVLLTTIVQNG